MSGHNKWSKIKHKKAAGDQAKSKLFSKLANEISIAARNGIDPEFNPSLRGAIDRARKQNMPQANIERAVKRVAEAGDLDAVLVEAYGPEGVGIIIEAVTDNKNRTIGEIRSALKEFDSKIAEPGSLMWSFEKVEGVFRAKFSPAVSPKTRELVSVMCEAIHEMDDVVGIYTSVDAI